jgi:aspartokinase
VPFIVQSSFEEGEGTVVDEEQFEDGAQIVAVTGRPHVAVIDIADIPPRDGALTALFEDLDTLLEDMAGLHQYPASDATTLTFHIPVRPETEDVLDRLRRVCERHRASLNVDPEHAAVSLVGSGSVDAPAVAARGHRALSAAGVACSSLITGNLSLTFLVARGAYAAAETALHREFLEQS